MIPAKGNRVIAKPYVISISTSGSKQVVPSITAKPKRRTITAPLSMLPTKTTKPSVVQTKLNDFFKVHQSSLSSINTIRETVVVATPNINPSLERTSQSIIRSSGNFNFLVEPQKISNSTDQTQSSTVKPEKSPKLLETRSQIYDFDESFMNTQISVLNGKQTNGQNTSKLANQPGNVSRVEPQTPIISKLINAKSNGNEFVSARSIINSSRNEYLLLFEEDGDGSFESSFSLTQNEHCKPKNIVACIETYTKALPKHGRCPEQSIADILNCEVNAINLSRKFRNEFEVESVNQYEEISLPKMRQPLQCVSNILDARPVTTPPVLAKDKLPPIQKEHFCDTYYSNDSADLIFPPIAADLRRTVDSPKLERKKQKRNDSFDFDFNFSKSDTNEWNVLPENMNNNISSNDSGQKEFPNDGQQGSGFRNIPERNHSTNNLATDSSFDGNRVGPQNVEMFWSHEDDSPDASTESKISIIDELIANRNVREGNAKNQMKKPSGKMVQARVKRADHSSTRSEALHRSWDPSNFDQNVSKEYIRRKIFRLPEENSTHSNRDSVDDDDTMTFCWLSD